MIEMLVQEPLERSKLPEVRDKPRFDQLVPTQDDGDGVRVPVQAPALVPLR
jgi:hypothetical protein